MSISNASSISNGFNNLSARYHAFYCSLVHPLITSQISLAVLQLCACLLKKAWQRWSECSLNSVHPSTWLTTKAPPRCAWLQATGIQLLFANWWQQELPLAERIPPEGEYLTVMPSLSFKTTIIFEKFEGNTATASSDTATLCFASAFLHDHEDIQIPPKEGCSEGPKLALSWIFRTPAFFNSEKSIFNENNRLQIVIKFF